MLALSRFEGERIRIGDVFIVIHRIVICEHTGRRKVRIAIEAPDDVQIVREEIDDPENWGGIWGGTCSNKEDRKHG